MRVAVQEPIMVNVGSVAFGEVFVDAAKVPYMRVKYTVLSEDYNLHYDQLCKEGSIVVVNLISGEIEVWGNSIEVYMMRAEVKLTYAFRED